ncbi:MAG TPA: sulfotransferase [Trebonia sp.]|jgi:hypothetical protein
MTDIGTADELMESASTLTGLSDFGSGSDGFTDGLQELLASYSGDEELTPAGVKAARAQIRGALMARLAAESAWSARPSHESVAIERPIVVTGLPRTGTTALHRLLVADPAHQGLELWLSQVPQPRPPRSTWPDDPMYQVISASIVKHSVSRPEFLGVHELGADQVEECWQLLRQSLRSAAFECLAHLPSYSSWLASQDWVPAYERHRRNLQLIGSADADKRWVLKNPSHLFALDALLTVYPDALVIQTHRDPRTAIASACSLADQATRGWSEVFTGEVIGRDQLELWARGLDEFRAARSRHDPSRFYDVGYGDFVTDPIATVEAVYAHFGLELTPAAADAMRALIAADTARRSGGAGGGDGGAEAEAGGPASPPAHRYTLEEFGLSPRQVDERFARYLADSGVRRT